MTIGSSSSRSRISCMTLLLRAHSARIPSLRQQPFDEVEALLRLGQLLSQLAHFAFHRFKSILEFAATGELLPTGTGPQAPRPEPERHRERHVNRGMLRLRLPDCEPGPGQVDDAQHDGDRVPGRGLEGHQRSFRKHRTRPTSTNPTAWWAAALTSLSGSASEANSRHPCERPHPSAAAISARPTPRPRASGTTNHPSRYATRSP